MTEEQYSTPALEKWDGKVRDGVWLYQLNVTRACDLRCKQCYIESEIKDNSPHMTGMKFLEVINGIAEHMDRNGKAVADIHIIGGEPSMLGERFFKTYLPMARRVFENKPYEARFLLVTNLATDRALAVARLFDTVSTSYEPKARFNKEKIFHRWEENVRELAASQDTHLTINTTIIQDTVREGASKLLDYYLELGADGAHFGFFVPEGDGLANRDEMQPPLHQVSEFLIESGEWALEHRGTGFQVSPFESFLESVYSDTLNDAVCCPMITGSLDIDSTGAAHSCLSKGGSSAESPLADIYRDGVEGSIRSIPFKVEVQSVARRNPACEGCQYWHICRSGCSIVFRHWRPEIDRECPGYKMFFEYLEELIADGVRPLEAGGRITDMNALRSC